VSISLVARRYAAALREIGEELRQLDTLNTEISNVAELYEGSAELRIALESPLVDHASKRAIVATLAKRLAVGQIAQNTLALLVDRRRIKTLPAIAKFLREMTDKKRGVLRAEVTTAVPCSDDYYERLKVQLEKMTGKTVVVERQVDPQIISGVVTRIGDRVFDGSVRTRLQTMRDMLMPSA
jgi:F-type H+-transporting ATPase subunit delta